MEVIQRNHPKRKDGENNDNVNDTNNDYKNMKRLSNTLNNVDKELKEKMILNDANRNVYKKTVKIM